MQFYYGYMSEEDSCSRKETIDHEAEMRKFQKERKICKGSRYKPGYETLMNMRRTKRG